MGDGLANAILGIWCLWQKRVWYLHCQDGCWSTYFFGTEHKLDDAWSVWYWHCSGVQWLVHYELPVRSMFNVSERLIVSFENETRVTVIFLSRKFVGLCAFRRRKIRGVKWSSRGCGVKQQPLYEAKWETSEQTSIHNDKMDLETNKL